MQEINISYFAVPGVEKKCRINPEIIISEVCKYFHVEKRHLTAKGRYRHKVTPRHIAMYLLRTHTHETLLSIGQLFNRDHTTVINAMQKINGFISIKDESTIMALESIGRNLEGVRMAKNQILSL